MTAILFDLDGTIADTESLHLKAFNMAFEAEGCPFYWSTDVYRMLLRQPGGRQRLMLFFAEDGSVPDAERAALAGHLHGVKTGIYQALLAEGDMAARPGVRRLIAECRAAGWQAGVVTTSRRSATTAVLAAALPGVVFDVVICGDDVAALKPSPDGYLLALERLPDRRNVVVVEDSPQGMAAARAAGLPVLLTLNDWFRRADFSVEQQKAALLMVDDLDASPPVTEAGISCLLASG